MVLKKTRSGRGREPEKNGMVMGMDGKAGGVSECSRTLTADVRTGLDHRGRVRITYGGLLTEFSVSARAYPSDAGRWVHPLRHCLPRMAAYNSADAVCTPLLDHRARSVLCSFRPAPQTRALDARPEPAAR